MRPTCSEAYARRLANLEAEVLRCESVCHDASSGAEQLVKVRHIYMYIYIEREKERERERG